MKKQPRFDFGAECNFSGLSLDEIETACVYECIRESRAAQQALINSRSDSETTSQPRLVAPFIQRLPFDNIVSLIMTLREAGFPKPWKKLDDKAHKKLAAAMSGWDEALKQRYPPVVLEDATPERDLEREQPASQKRMNAQAEKSDWKARYLANCRVRVPNMINS